MFCKSGPWLIRYMRLTHLAAEWNQPWECEVLWCSCAQKALNAGRFQLAVAAAEALCTDERTNSYGGRLRMVLLHKPADALIQQQLVTGTDHPSVWLGGWQTASANEHSLHIAHNIQHTGKGYLLQHLFMIHHLRSNQVWLISEMTYYVSNWMLNSTQSLTQVWQLVSEALRYDSSQTVDQQALSCNSPICSGS